MSVTLQTPQGELRMAPRPEGGQIRWYCLPGEGLKPSLLPKTCQPGPQ
jgi:hypothetical protein